MQIERLDGGKTEIADAAFQELRTAFRGSLIVPGDDEFDEARRVWNGMIDRRPGLIAQCSGAADVIAAVNFASDSRAVRRRARRWAQLSGAFGLRRWPGDRSDPDAGCAG